MRDLATVLKGEHVYVHLPYKGDTVIADGIFDSVLPDGRIRVNHTTTFSFSHVGAVDQFVTDVHGETLGVPEPDLRGEPPELE